MELVNLRVTDIFVIFFLLAPFFSRRGVHRAHFGGGARSDVCLNGRGVRPVSGNRGTGAVNRARMSLSEISCAEEDFVGDKGFDVRIFRILT